MEAIIGYIYFTDKFECCIHFIFCPSDYIVAFIPWKLMCRSAKWIRSVTIERMPIRTGKLKILFHRLATNNLFWIIITESQWICTVLSFELNLANAFEKFFFPFDNIHLICYLFVCLIIPSIADNAPHIALQIEVPLYTQVSKNEKLL
ncbi:hypothetical protein D3C81_994090 [compost metagenome]